MTNVTCGLTAKKLGSSPCPALVIEYGTFYYLPYASLAATGVADTLTIAVYVSLWIQVL